jgi:hypothetical protein
MKHTFTKKQIKRIIIEELQADLLIENTTNQLIEEGVVETVKNLKNKFFPNKSDEEIDTELEEIGRNPSQLEKMPRSKRIGILFLAGLLGGFLTQASFDYNKLGTASAADAKKILSSQQVTAQKSKDIINFRQMASSETLGKTASTQKEVDAKVREIIDDYGSVMKPAPISPGRGLFVGGDPAKGNFRGFAYVPSENIPDDEIMPFIAMSKADYEILLRATYLSGTGGDKRLADIVMGRGRAGSSVFWAYSNRSSYQGYNRNSTIALLPLEWSVAYGLLQKRQNRGKR